MKRNKEFHQNDYVRFIKKSTVFDIENNTEFTVPVGTTAKIILDEDAGEIGSCKIMLKKKNGEKVIAKTNDQNLEVQK